MVTIAGSRHSSSIATACSISQFPNRVLELELSVRQNQKYFQRKTNNVLNAVGKQRKFKIERINTVLVKLKALKEAAERANAVDPDLEGAMDLLMVTEMLSQTVTDAKGVVNDKSYQLEEEEGQKQANNQARQRGQVGRGGSSSKEVHCHRLRRIRDGFHGPEENIYRQS